MLSLFMPRGHIRGPEIHLHSLTLTLDQNEWSTWCSNCFTASKITPDTHWTGGSTFWRRENSVAPVKNWIPGCSALSIVTIPTMPAWCRNWHFVSLLCVKSYLLMQLQYFMYKCSMELLWTVLLCDCKFALLPSANFPINHESGINCEPFFRSGKSKNESWINYWNYINKILHI